MSALVHCDGPGCENTRDATPMARLMSDPTWLRLEERPDSEPRDFCSSLCLAKWTVEQPGSSTTAVDGQ